MAVCANCPHWATHHGDQGCTYVGCACPFDPDFARGPAPNQGEFPCQVCQESEAHHDDCPWHLRLPDGGGCMACACGPLAEHADDCLYWAFLGKTWARLRREEAFGRIANPARARLDEKGRNVEAALSSARDSQVGGAHYNQHKIQVWDIWQEYKLDPFTGAVIKYLLRDKGSRLQDLKKARHTLDRLIEIEEGN